MVLRIVFLTTLLTVSIGSATQPASDADIVQQTLAKIVFAHQVEVIQMSFWGKVGKAVVTEKGFVAALNQKALQLEASNITTGPVQQIANQPLIELVSSLPNGKFLDVGSSTTQYSNQSKNLVAVERTAPVMWNGNGGLTESRLPATLNDYIKVNPSFACTNYVSATIAATYEGQSASWRALYFTGCPTEGFRVQAIDLVMRDAVPNFWNADVYPYILQGGWRAANPAVQQWLQQNASPSCLTKATVCHESGRVVIPLQDALNPIGDVPVLPTKWGLGPTSM